jgi:hypothetical protein
MCLNSPRKSANFTIPKGSNPRENASLAGLLQSKTVVAAAVTVAAMAADARKDKCMMLFAQAAASIPRSPSSLMAANRFIAVIATKVLLTKGDAHG